MSSSRILRIGGPTAAIPPPTPNPHPTPPHPPTPQHPLAPRQLRWQRPHLCSAAATTTAPREGTHSRAPRQHLQLRPRAPRRATTTLCTPRQLRWSRPAPMCAMSVTLVFTGGRAALPDVRCARDLTMGRCEKGTGGAHLGKMKLE